MTKKGLCYILIAFLSLLILSCSSTTATPTVLNDSPGISPTNTVSSLVDETPDPTLTSDNSRYTKSCVVVLDKIPEDLNLNGFLVVYSHQEDIISHLWDLSSGDKLLLPGEFVGGRVSPDRKLLAYSDSELDSIVVIDAGGNPMNIINKPDTLAGISIWLDNQRLVLDLSNEHNAEGIIVLDITTAEIQEYSQEFPNFTEYPQDLNWREFGQSRMMVNSPLTHLVYPSDDYWDFSLVLWDLQTNLEAGRVYQHYNDYAGVFEGAPVWFANGFYFITSAAPRYTVDFENPSDPIHPLQDADEITENAFINLDDKLPYVDGFELIRVSLSGEKERLSYLTTTYFARQSDWVLSPDESKIAFWLSIYQDDKYIVADELAVLDIESGEVTNYCISGFYPPIWSPDGTKILINQSRSSPSTYTILDLEEGIVVPIIEDQDVYIDGWMLSMP